MNSLVRIKARMLRMAWELVILPCSFIVIAALVDWVPKVQKRWLLGHVTSPQGLMPLIQSSREMGCAIYTLAS